MEIALKNKSVSVYKELSHQIKRHQDSIDSVVPDVNDDVGKIVTYDHSLFLKSKDVTSNGVLVNGEIQISILYITETEDNVSSIKLNKPFMFEFDIPDIKPTAIPQINMRLNNIESRIINPRKLSVSYELFAELSVFTTGDIDECSIIDEEHARQLKYKIDSVNVSVPNAVCEKTFALNEQFLFSSSNEKPRAIIFARPTINITDTQHVGSKLIVKGSMTLNVCYHSSDCNYPHKCEFTSNFSQIVDTGTEESDSCVLKCEITSFYYNLVETISGDYALDTELHALTQLVNCKKQAVEYISDAYCNTMPWKNNMNKEIINGFGESMHERIDLDEKINVADDCKDILCVFPSVCQLAVIQNKLSGIINFDIIYKNKNDCICSVRRSCSITSDELCSGARLIDYRITSINIRPNETLMDAKIVLTVYYQCSNTVEYSKVCSVELDEEHRIDLMDYPSITLVKYDNESLWDLAKKYPSSVDKIAALNDLEKYENNFIMIPKEC